MHDDTQPQILSPEDSALWRQAYLDAFVDTSSEHYQRLLINTGDDEKRIAAATGATPGGDQSGFKEVTHKRY